MTVRKLKVATIVGTRPEIIRLSRVMAALLYDTSPADPATLAATAVLLLAVAAIAGYIPALRASRVDPMTALRAE